MPRNSTNYVISGTKTFRLGSRKILRKWGTNLQNIEKGMRAMYIPDPGKVFVQVDQSGAEALIVAYLCRQGNFRDLFTQGVKPHVFVGLHVFKEQWKDYFRATGISDIPDIDEMCTLPIVLLKKHKDFLLVDKVIKSSDNWPAQKRYYYIAKMICHASNYGMRASAFQLNVLEKSRGKIALSKKEAENYLTVYHTLFPEIHEWHREVERQLQETAIIYNLFGYPKSFFYPSVNPPDNILKDAYAQCPQSTVGCITHIEFTDEYNFIEITNRINTVHQLPKIKECVQEALDRFGSNQRLWDLLANTHDSTLSQCPDNEYKNCAEVKQFFMNQELISPRGERFKMKSETQWGYNWAPKTEKNLEGLREV